VDGRTDYAAVPIAVGWAGLLEVVMTKRSGRLLLWSPRILGVLVCLFLSLFALDSFGPDKSLSQALRDFAIHIAPMLILAVVIGVSWRWEWVGGIVFVGLAVAYSYVARHHLPWIPTIAGPLLVVGVLFLWSWVHHTELRANG
jgi:hypothetical protein